MQGSGADPKLTSLRPSQDCFSMANVSWYGGASVPAQSWPINAANTSMQPFSVSDLRENPDGYGSVLERYFLGSSGKTPRPQGPQTASQSPELPLRADSQGPQ